MSPEPSGPPAAFESAGGSISIDEILDGLGEGFMAFASDWRFIAFNRAAEDLHGLSRDTVIGKTLWEVSPTIAGTEFDKRYRRVMAERVTEVFEAAPTRFPDRIHEIRAFPLGGGFGVAFRDVTDRRNMLETLQRREVELARVQRIGGVGGLRVDLRGGFHNRRSPEYLRLHGLPPDSANETHEAWVARIHPDDREKAVAQFLAAVAGDVVEYKSEYRIIRPSDGQVRWIRAVAEIERDEEGRAVMLVGAHIDITDRRVAELEAREMGERLRAIADALPMLISYVDKDQVFRFVNRAYEHWFERPREEIVGRKIVDVMVPAMYEARRPHVLRALRGETVSYEAEFHRSTGVFITEVVHVPHYDAQGAVVGLYTVVSDITGLKTSEKRLAESEARFRAIANSAPVPIWVTAPSGAREFVNQAYQDFLGLPYEEALVFDWRHALHPDDLQRIYKEQIAGESSGKLFTLEARYRRADGLWRWVRSESQPRWSPDGKQIGFIGVAHDVTEAVEGRRELTRINETLERRVEERTGQLAASEALLRSFFQHSSECHAILVEDGDDFRYREANPATLALYGKPRRAVVGKRIEEVLGKEAAESLAPILRTALDTGLPQPYERHENGAVIEALATAAPSGEGEPRRLIVSARDATERRRLEEQLRQSQKMEALGQLTGGVAHDFNNMLTLILGGVDIIERQIPQLPTSPPAARIQRAKDMALQGVQRAKALTTRLLAFSRRQALEPQAVDANILVAGICDLLRRALGEQIALHTNLAPDIWTAFVDPNQLENALINLAVNARDAMSDGGKLVIETSNRSLGPESMDALSERIEPGDYVMIAVEDTGAGMDEETRKRAFDPFFTTKEIGKGTGLGLSQVYGFTRQSSGNVQIDSEPGKGTTVRLFLPRDSRPVQEYERAPRAETRHQGGWERVLVVEDDDALRAYASEALRELGYRVSEARNGPAALTQLDAEPVDLVLTDLVMPGGMNGAQLAEEALARHPHLGVVFMTGYSRDALRPGGATSAIPVLYKPFSIGELAAKVRDRLDGAHTRAGVNSESQ